MPLSQVIRQSPGRFGIDLQTSNYCIERSSVGRQILDA
jgi:hypothetical protein